MVSRDVVPQPHRGQADEHEVESVEPRPVGLHRPERERRDEEKEDGKEEGHEDEMDDADGEGGDAGAQAGEEEGQDGAGGLKESGREMLCLT